MTLPQDAVTLFTQGIEQLQAGNYTAALTYFDSALAINPDDPNIWEKRASALYNLGQIKEAIASCDKAEEISSPSYQEIQQLLNPTTAIIYWHLSPAALTTFIIKHGAEEPDAISSPPFLRGAGGIYHLITNPTSPSNTCTTLKPGSIIGINNIRSIAVRKRIYPPSPPW